LTSTKKALSDGIWYDVSTPLQSTSLESNETNAGYQPEKSAKNKLKNAAVSVGRFVCKTIKNPKDDNSFGPVDKGDVHATSDVSAAPSVETEYQHIP
jgi:hypothetical protein